MMFREVYYLWFEQESIPYIGHNPRMGSWFEILLLLYTRHGVINYKFYNT